MVDLPWTIFGDWLRDRREQRRARSQADEAALVATRNIGAEIKEALTKISEGLQPDATWPRFYGDWSAWTKHRDTLGSRWDQQDFDTLNETYGRMRGLAHGMETKGGQELSQEDLRFFRESKTQLEEALTALGRTERAPLA